MYSHLTQQQRIELSLLVRLGHAKRAIARILGVAASTVCRELSRNTQNNTRYHATFARMRAKERRVLANQHFRKLDGNTELETLIADKLAQKQWSPDQISAWLKRTKQKITVCAQTIYDWIYTRRKDLLKYLRSQKQRYRHTRAYTLRKQKRDTIFSSRRIDKRPKIVESRSRYGHWEGDTIVSRKSKARIGTLVERKSGYLAAFLLTDGNSNGFARSAAKAISHVPDKYRGTMTLDNGTEMQSYELLEMLSGLDVYFAYPYHSWERGTNENTNGLLRQYFPKSSDLAGITQKQLDHVVELLNTRPRKRLGYRTPEEVFTRYW